MAQKQKPQDEGASHLDRLQRDAEVGENAPEVTSEKPGQQAASAPHRGGE